MARARVPSHWKRYKDIAWLLVKHEEEGPRS
jgi:hypothetical protein